MLYKHWAKLLVLLLILPIGGCAGDNSDRVSPQPQQPELSEKSSQENGLYDYALLYTCKNTSLNDSAKINELIAGLQYAKELRVDRVEYAFQNQHLLRIDYQLNLTEGQSYHIDHTKQMQDVVILFMLLDQLDAVEINLVQADYGYGGVPITREAAEQVLGDDTRELGKNENTFRTEIPHKIANLKWNPEVMPVVTYEHVMGLEE
ncbi:MAG TPA: hypothetical protein PLM20_04045 [Syntrophomonadaceae bacterium]|nr:hypothetical protein [Syntrophomonadaceae bacterium]HQE23054.1 hypothetical protein [Syntrophomonadaceae bacterium]